MPSEIISTDSRSLSIHGGALPAFVTDAGEQATRRFLEFFAAQIRNRNTRAAYARSIGRFARWCDERGIGLVDVSPFLVAAYIEQLSGELARPSVKQHLAAIKMLYDWLVTGQIVPTNPATSVRGPKHVVKKGLTPVLTGGETRQLLDSIDVSTVSGLRDRALIGVMVYSFARVGAMVAMRVEDYFPQGRRMWFRLHEKGGKQHDVPAHHSAEEFVDAYLAAAGIAHEKKSPLFRSLDSGRRLTDRGLYRTDVLAMIKRRARDAGLPEKVCCHTFRATGITAYLLNGGTLENAQRIASHESARTTKLYDRTSDTINLDEIEKIVL